MVSHGENSAGVRKVKPSCKIAGCGEWTRLDGRNGGPAYLAERHHGTFSLKRATCIALPRGEVIAMPHAAFLQKIRRLQKKEDGRRECRLRHSRDKIGAAHDRQPLYGVALVFRFDGEQVQDDRGNGLRARFWAKSASCKETERVERAGWESMGGSMEQTASPQDELPAAKRAVQRPARPLRLHFDPYC